MVKLVVGNSYSQAQGLSVEQEKALRKALSYKTSSYGSGSFPTTRYLIDRKGFFPTGLLKLVKDTLVVGGDQVDTRIKPTRGVDLGGPSLRLPPGLNHVQLASQREIALQAVKAERGTVVMPTGTGKSITMAILVHLLQIRTLIVVPNLTLKEQLTKSFREMFGDTPYIRIENIDSSALDTLSDFDAIIIDECHHVAAKTFRDLNKKVWKGIYYRFFFTATPYRSKDEEQILMESVAGQVIYSLTYKQAVEQGFIVPVEVFYIELPKVPVKGNTWPQVYKELVTHRKDRNEVIQSIMLSAYHAGCSTLCLVKEIAHGKLLSNEGAFAFANGQDENTTLYLSQFALGQRKSLVGTVGVCGEGSDTKACEFVIVAGLGKSKPQFAQQIGRAVRRWPRKDSAKIIIFRDPSHRWTLSHFNAQVRYVKELFGIKPAKLNI